MGKILVTGGAGFIGSALVNKLSDEHDIYVIDNLSYGNKDFITIDEDKFYGLDILDKEYIIKVINDISPDIIIHLAAIHFIPDCNKYPFESSKTNIQGTKNILEAAAKLDKLDCLFFASTAAVYPIIDHPIRETDEKDPLDIYGLSKITGEYLCSDFHQKTGVPTVVGRFFNAFGPNETNPHLIPEIEKQLKEGKRTIQLGNLEPKRDFIHTSDMAEFVSRLVFNPPAGLDTYNIGSGIEYSVLEVVAEFENALQEKITVEQNPARIRKVERMHLMADISKVIEKTGWKPQINLSEGIKDLMNEEKAPSYSMH
ncbi:NAD-dependent epimerase/dehydratase family protein [Peijinzhouia sedimentorum]